MKPAIDAGNLIACSSCAKAKAKCDKRLPTCSRCLYKRLKCEPRPPRRYPETFQFFQAQAQAQAQAQSQAQSQSQSHTKTQTQTISPPSSNTPSPPNQGDTVADDSFSQLFSISKDTEPGHVAPFETLQWHHSPPMTLDTCPGDLSIDRIGDNTNPFDTAILADPTLFPVHDSSMDYHFASNFDVHVSNSQGPPDPVLGASLTSAPHMPLAPLPPNWANNPNIPLNNALDEDWTCFRCNPPSNQPINPRIGSNFLRRLEETLNDQSVWNNTELLGHVPDCEATLYIEPVQESIRDKLLVISQGFLSRARDIHRAGADDSSFSRSRSSSTVAAANFAGFFILPPPVVLEVFLKMYACRVEPYLPFFPASAIGITQLIASNSNDEKSSILLLLLMIAHGAMGSPMPEALHLASGLIETCRICMYDVMEKHVRMAVHPVMLRCALMYLNAAAWSGNKWHMDLAAAQMRMYMSIVRYSRILDARKSSLANLEFSVQTEASWKTWQAEETINRLAYSWVFLDQEMNLIHDRQPELEIHDLNSPIPDNEELWRSISADVWQGTLNKLRQSRSYRADSTPPSLAALFNKFMGNDLSNSSTSLSPTELRLLLHPLQAMIYHLNKSMVYFFHSGSHRLLQRLLTQLEEVHYLLKQWYTLSIQAMDRMETSRNIYYSNMIMFHLISLTAITYFPDIERLARGEVASDKFGDSLWAGKRCIEEAPQIWCHCGQVIRYSRQMPASSRPFWWGAAIYRTALYMWATSLAQQTHGTSNTLSGMERINVDTLAFDHPSLVRYQLHQVDGVPVLSDEHGNDVSFAAPTDAITFCVNLVRINNGWGSQLDEGICARLLGLAERWKDG